MDNTYAQVVGDFDLAKMRDRLNDVCAGFCDLDLPAAQDIRLLVERLLDAQTHKPATSHIYRVVFGVGTGWITIWRRYGDGSCVGRMRRPSHGLWRRLNDLLQDTSFCDITETGYEFY